MGTASDFDQRRWNHHGAEQLRAIKANPERYRVRRSPLEKLGIYEDFIEEVGPISGKRILELGCGDGRHSVFLAREGAEVTGIDIGHLIRPVTNTEKADFTRDGVVCLKAIYPAEWVARLESELDDVFSQSDSRRAFAGTVLNGDSELGASSDMVRVLEDTRARAEADDLALEGDAAETPTGRSIVETDASHWHPGMRSHHLRGPVPDLLHQLTGSSKINFYSDQLFLKEPGSRVKTPFHQDKPYFLVDGGDVAIVWIPVDVVDSENGAMGYVVGSHRWGKLFKPSDFATNRGTFPEVGGISLEGLDDLPENLLDEADVRYFDTEPGDVIVHHWATLHGSRGNTSATRTRRAASIRYALEGCRFFKRPSSPEPFRNTVNLEDGAVLESADRFPIVWPR